MTLFRQLPYAEAFALPALFLILAAICWCRMWGHFARKYPTLKDEYFPNGAAHYVPRDEWRRWPEVWRRIRGDKQIRRTVLVMWIAIVLFFGFFILQAMFRITRESQLNRSEDSRSSEIAREEESGGQQLRGAYTSPAARQLRTHLPRRRFVSAHA